VVGSVFDLHWLRGRPDPALAPADQTEMQAAMAEPDLAFPLLPMQVEKGGGHDLRVELGRRERLGREPDLRGAVALGYAQGVVDDRRRVDLHGHRIGIGGVQAIEIEHFLEIEEHPFHAPAMRVEIERLLGAQAARGASTLVSNS